ncbi:MAG TPA: TonB-dependent receptor [Thermoanaerobaculia bacterium]|nr:TonB-dependent receptor [Thermoanaerobaculia bacterium]
MRLRVALLCLGCALLLALAAAGQAIPSGTLSGKVTADKRPLPGVTVSVTSPALQGTRTVVTNGNGDYILALLPPGLYKVSFEIEGFKKAERQSELAVAQSTPLDVELSLAGVTETIVVTGTASTISTTTDASTTYDKRMIEALPLDRNIRQSVLLAPGVAATGPTGANAQNRGLVISGGQSYENLFLVNGVVITENIRGQPFDLFIEDAIQETTTTSSGISAEYGRFAGGVVNVITKTGGNEFHGSARDWLTNDHWSSPTPLTVSRQNKANNRYEATLGGWLWKDHLWFFGAGRDLSLSQDGQTTATLISYPTQDKQKRGEGKLTFSPLDGQRLTASYIKINEADNGNSFLNILDTASLNNRSLPQELLAINYNGVYGSNFFGEAQYSKRKFTFIHSGSLFTDLIRGTLLVDSVTGNRWNSPTFCGVCTPESRDNSDVTLKASWFLSAGKLGSHDIAVGVDRYDDIRKANNHQSGSDYRIIITSTITRGTSLFPQLLNTNGTYIQFNPILLSSQGTNFYTNSAYINDRWRPIDRLSLNIGLRFDKNDGSNSQGQKTAKDHRLSPRLGAAYDLKGDGDWILNAGYGRYVTAIANSEADATSIGGNPATFQWFYRGPVINPDPNAPNLVPASVALQQVFDWFASIGGTNNTSLLRAISIPGGTTIIRNSLDSPYTDEISAGVAKRLGRRGELRAQYVHRNSAAFYALVVDQSTGRTTTATGAPSDLAILKNLSNPLKRSYDGLHTNFQYRATDRLGLGGSWTLSRLHGNVLGENAGSGPILSAALNYPEYRQQSWDYPGGDLFSDQRHRLRAWGIYDIWKSEHNLLSAGVLESYASGIPYGAVGAVDSRPFVTNPGYVRPPSTVAYYYTARDAFHTDNVASTDLTLNYSYQWNAWSKTVEVFVQPQVLNVFNQHGALNVDASINDPTTDKTKAPFNPFTTKPVEGVNWSKAPTFGKPQVPTDYQLARTFRFSVGFRF